MNNTQAKIPKATLLGLPVELRLSIFRSLWQSLVVEVERGPGRWPDGNVIANSDQLTRSCEISPLPGTPRDVIALRLACQQFRTEIDDSWHSEVTYHFPTTVSFIDVLSQWPKAKVCALRYARVVDTPLPLYAYDNEDFFITHTFGDALPMFPGLRLEVLTLENIWLLPNGRPLDGWCVPGTNGAIINMLFSSGWRRFEYISGILSLTPTQMEQLETLVENHRIENFETGFKYGLGRVRPQIHSLANFLDPSGDPEDIETAKKLVDKWYASHREEKQPRDAMDYPEDVTQLHLAVWAERGTKANYIQDGTELGPTLKSFNDHQLTWVELRETDRFLVGDGLSDPTGYL